MTETEERKDAVGAKNIQKQTKQQAEITNNQEITTRPANRNQMSKSEKKHWRFKHKKE